MVETMVRQGMTNYYLGNEVGVMEKKRWIAWTLALFMVATPCMSFAQEISGTAGSTNESESNEPVNPDKATEQDRADAKEDGNRESSKDSAADSEEDKTGANESSNKTEASADSDNSKEAAATAETTASKAVDDKWTTADFTYGEYEKLMYGCDYSRQFYVCGKVITGFSKQGEEKLKSNKNLVIPAKGPDGKNIVGIGESAFKEKGLESVQFPTGMLTPYDDPLAKTDEERVSRRGNFVIGESSFYGNKLKEVVLPTGVISVLAKAFEQNEITKVKLPKTIWWIENQGFADNKITDVQFPVTTDFMMELHGMPFAFNKIKSVRLPNFTEVVNKFAFAYNPGMADAPKMNPWGKENKLEAELRGEKRSAGLVYMYTDNPGLKDKLQNRLHSVEGKNTNIYSPYQKLVVCDGTAANQNPDQTLWNAKDFEYNEDGVITGLSESGIAKRKVNTDLVIPSKTPDGETVVEIGSTDSNTGLFATETEKFDSVYMPNTVRKIGDRAFCSNGLKEVTFSGTLTSIGMVAFSNNELTSVVLPDSVNHLGNGAFSTNPNIERIILSKNLREIPDAAFGCSDKYHYMTNLTEIEIPDTVTKIGSRAFAGSNIHNIAIPDSVKEIGEYAFSTKNYLNEPCTVSLPEGLETIGDNAFRNKVIAEIDLPSTVKGLKLNTFRKEYTSDGHKVNGSVTKVYVKTAEQYNDKENFPCPKEGTEAFHKLYLADPMIWTSDDYTYSKAESGVTEITGFSELGERKLAQNKDIVLPEADDEGNAVAGVAAEAFREKGIASVELPSAENFTVGESAFRGNNINELELNSGITEIGNNSFRDNRLTKVDVTSTVTRIGESAFESNRIREVRFEGDGTNAPSLETRCFAGNKIQALEIPKATTSMKGDAFIGNTGKEKVETGTPEEQSGGVVYVYVNTTGTVPEGLENISNGKSNVQKVMEGQIPAAEAPWGSRHFTYNVAGNIVTGLSAEGKEKLKNNSEVIIPSRINNVPVTGIGNGAEGIGTFGFTEGGKTYVPKKVILPKALKNIGDYAFDASGLTEIELPDQMETIGNYAFRNVKATELQLPKTVKTIGKGAFEATDKKEASLEKVSLAVGMTVIPENAFRGQKLKNVTLPKNITEVESGAFADNKVETLNFNENLKSIGSGAFENHQLKKLVIPENVTEIGDSAFAVTDSSLGKTLTDLKLSRKLRTVGENAFGRSALKELELPDSVEVLPASAFSGNTAVAEVWTSSNKQIAGAAPYEKVAAKGDGHQLMYDKLVGTGWGYSDFVFSEDGKTVLGWSASGKKVRMDNHHLVIPDKASREAKEYITVIGKEAFAIPLAEVTIGKYDCTSPNGLQSVKFPKYLERIEAGAFEYNNLRNHDADGNIVDTPTETTGENHFLANQKYLTYIGGSAFHGNHLCNVELPDTVTEVGDGAFSMNNIYKLKLSENMTVISAGAFSMNIRMSSITIPDKVTEIGQTAFAGARLKSLTIPKSVTKIGRKAFHLHQMKSLTIPGNVKEVGESAFEGTYKAASLENLVIESGVKTIGERAFKEGHLSTVVLPDSVESIGKAAFMNNTGNTRITGHPVLVLTNNSGLLKTNTADENFRVQLRSLAKNGTKVSGVKNKTYSGKSQTQKITVKNSLMTLNSGSEYKVSYSGNKSVGTATMKITGIGNYNGTITKTFKINPKGTSLKSVKKGKKSFKATWKKSSKTWTTGYQVQYSTSKKFKKAKTTTVKSYKKTKATVKKLKKKKTYYVHMRTYKTVKGKKYYSGWSKVKKVKTK